MAEVAILIPAMRPQNLPGVVATIAESTSDYCVVIVATGECAEVARNLEGPIEVIDDGGGTFAQRINLAYKSCNASYVFTGADDLAFRSGWFIAAMRVMEAVNGVVAVNDLHNMGGVHFLISRNYIDTLGGTGDGIPGVVCCEAYSHSYVDDEIRAVARHHNRWGFAQDAIVEHMHPGAGKAPSDDVYRIGEASMSQGLAMYRERAHLWDS